MLDALLRGQPQHVLCESNFGLFTKQRLYFVTCIEPISTLKLYLSRQLFIKHSVLLGNSRGRPSCKYHVKSPKYVSENSWYFS